MAGGARTFDALKKLWPLWIALLVIASAGAILRRVIFRETETTRLERVLLFVFAGLWSLLFWNNARLLPFNAGFDAKEHLEYISYIQEHRALPLPSEGWEMYQPPLYYLIAAGSLTACKLSTGDSASIFVLRSLGFFLGLSNSCWCFSVCDSCFLRTAFVGLLLAVCLPMHLYLAHYVTNEMLAAALATLTLYLCLRLLRSDTPRVSQLLAWIGGWRCNVGESDGSRCCRL